VSTELLTAKVGSMSRTIVDLLRLVRTLRAEYTALSEVLGIALEMLRESDRQLKAARDRYLSLLAQHRALISGRTNAEERQKIDETHQLAEVSEAA